MKGQKEREEGVRREKKKGKGMEGKKGDGRDEKGPAVPPIFQPWLR